jgi:hypothetical protein
MFMHEELIVFNIAEAAAAASSSFFILFFFPIIEKFAAVNI